MVGKSVKLSPKNSTQDLSPFTSNLKVCGKKGALPHRRSGGNLAKDLSDIPDAEVVGYLNNKNEVLLKKMAWELMNPDYEKSKPTTVKKKDPINKTAPSMKTSAARTESNAESENKKRPSSMINYDVLDKLFDAEDSPKSAKLKKPVAVADEMVCSQQNREDSLLKQQVSEEDEEQQLNEDYSNEDDYGGVEEYYGDEDLEFEDQDQLEDNEDIIW
ncbi:unnamed protein product [Cochlearia groenlandica]